MRTYCTCITHCTCIAPTYTHTHTPNDGWMHTLMCSLTHTHTHMRTHAIHTETHTHMHNYECTHMYTLCMHACMHTYTRTHACSHYSPSFLSSSSKRYSPSPTIDRSTCNCLAVANSDPQSQHLKYSPFAIAMATSNVSFSDGSRELWNQEWYFLK